MITWEEQLREKWEGWVREAAAKKGLTVEEAKRQLADGEAMLEISTTIELVKQ